MAASVAMLSTSSAVFAPLAAKHSLNSTAAFRAPAMLTAPRRNALVVRAEDPLSQVRQAVDSKTKVDITADDVKANMAKTDEKQSVVGTIPASGSTLGRSELDRRPETGSKNFFSVMAFDGPGPETMNGRLAMVGCAWGLVSELLTGQRIADQVNYPGSPGLFWLLTTAQIIIWASLVPIFNGESPDSRKNGPFTAQAERWNGRLAMVGFAGILIWEYIFGRAIFHL